MKEDKTKEQSAVVQEAIGEKKNYMWNCHAHIRYRRLWRISLERCNVYN